jgi:hypothetical protein
MDNTYQEVEDKYDAEPAFALPPLTGTASIASVDEPHTDELVAT